MFVTQGPNWIWAMDGHEKLAQPFGIYIYGIIDTYSRKVLSLKVLPNKKKETIAQWLMNEINNMQGLLLCVVEHCLKFIYSSVKSAFRNTNVDHISKKHMFLVVCMPRMGTLCSCQVF